MLLSVNHPHVHARFLLFWERLMAVLIVMAALVFAGGCASRPDSQTTVQPPWADTNHDGFLSDEEFQAAYRKLMAQKEELERKQAELKKAPPQ
jgi:uncharacterized protein YecT (DUF1311 family)